MAILHYSRGAPYREFRAPCSIYDTDLLSSIPEIPSHLLNQPVRLYPLREVNEPAVYVVGERAGQKFYPGQHQAQQRIASVSSHNANMARMEQRRGTDKRDSLVSFIFAFDSIELPT